MDSERLKQILRNYNIRPNVTYGQNFLMDEIALEDIVDASGVNSEDCVLEIGPGIGNLTRKLCQRAKLVLSVEKDPAMLPILKAVKKDCKNFHYEIADALEFDYQKFILDNGFKNFKVVANIPYYITGKILQLLLTAKFKPESVTLLMQKEVAQNAVAPVGDMSVFSISVQLYGEPKILNLIPAKSFFPSPKVDSAVLQVKVFPKPKYEIDEKKFFAVVRACFAGKRKQIHNTLVNNLKLPKAQVEEILTELKISPLVRPQQLTISQWVELVNKIFGIQK